MIYPPDEVREWARKRSVVRLVSGGPSMTVVEILGNGLVATVWFAGDEVRESAFPPGSLVLVEE